MLAQMYKKLGYLISDNIELLTRKRDEMTPPQRMIFVGPGDFVAIGQEFLGHFIRIGGLKPDAKVLDVGSGIGRMAVPLTKYLSSNGSYDGFDIVKDGVQWCQKHITKRLPNFHFLHADIFNREYNTYGKQLARDYKFPYDDEAYDFVFLTSVFTHMLQDDVENYAGEIFRVLKEGGRAFITFFLINEEARILMKDGRSELTFLDYQSAMYATSRENPEAVTGYDEAYVRDMFAKKKLKIIEPIQYGRWCGRTHSLSYQDILILKKQLS